MTELPYLHGVNRDYEKPSKKQIRRKHRFQQRNKFLSSKPPLPKFNIKKKRHVELPSLFENGTRGKMRQKMKKEDHYHIEMMERTKKDKIECPMNPRKDPFQKKLKSPKLVKGLHDRTAGSMWKKAHSKKNLNLYTSPNPVKGTPSIQKSKTITYDEEQLAEFLNERKGLLYKRFSFPHGYCSLYDQSKPLNSEDYSGTDFSKVDSFAKHTPYEYTRSISELASYLCGRWNKPIDKVRSIFTWVTENISYHAAASMGLSTPSIKAGSVLEKRITVCEGYANLFRALCEAENIECKKIHGYAKGMSFKIGEALFSGDANHAWNAVRIDGHWVLIDATWGAGFVELNQFQKKFNPHYFCTNPKKLIYDHYPQDEKWQMLYPPLTKQVYLNLPKLTGVAFDIGLDPYNEEAKTVTSIVDSTICYAFSVKEQIETVSLRLSCLSSKVKDLDQYAQYIVRGTQLYVLVSFPFRGHYELQIFLKPKNSDNFNVPLAVTYQIKVRKSLPFNVGYFSYGTSFGNQVCDSCCVVQPLQKELVKYSTIPFHIITAKPVEQVVVAVGYKPEGAYVSGKQYTHKKNLQEMEKNVYTGNICISPPPGQGKLVCQILIRAKGEKLPHDEYGWIRYIVVTYDVVSLYSEFIEDMGQDYVLRTQEEEREFQIQRKLDVANVSDLVEQLEQNGPIAKSFQEKGFRALEPTFPMLNCECGQRITVRIQSVENYFISCNLTRFSLISHPGVIYYDSSNNVVSTELFFKYPGQYVANFFAKKFGEATTFYMAKYVINVTGVVCHKFSTPLIQTLSYEKVMIYSMPWQKYMADKPYPFELLIHSKMDNIPGLQYHYHKNGQYIMGTMKPVMKNDTELTFWNGEISFPHDNPTVKVGQRYSKPLLKLSEELQYSSLDIPNYDDTMDIDLGKFKDLVSIGKHRKRLIHVNTEIFQMDIVIDQPRDNALSLQMKGKFFDFTGIVHKHGFYMEERKNGYQIRCRAKRSGMHCLEFIYRVPDEREAGLFRVYPGPKYWLLFEP